MGGYWSFRRSRVHRTQNAECRTHPEQGGQRELFSLHICPQQIHQRLLNLCGHATDFRNYVHPVVLLLFTCVCMHIVYADLCADCLRHILYNFNDVFHCYIVSNGIFISFWLDFLFFNCLIIFNWILSAILFFSNHFYKLFLGKRTC